MKTWWGAGLLYTPQFSATLLVTDLTLASTPHSLHPEQSKAKRNAHRNEPPPVSSLSVHSPPPNWWQCWVLRLLYLLTHISSSSLLVSKAENLFGEGRPIPGAASFPSRWLGWWRWWGRGGHPWWRPSARPTSRPGEAEAGWPPAWGWCAPFLGSCPRVTPAPRCTSPLHYETRLVDFFILIG